MDGTHFKNTGWAPWQFAAIQQETEFQLGLNEDGRREILIFDIVTTEDGTGWLAFFRGLKTTGLKGVELAISDAHPGLKDAIASVLCGAGNGVGLTSLSICLLICTQFLAGEPKWHCKIMT